MSLLFRRAATAGAGLAAVAITALTAIPSASATTVTTDRVQAGAGWLATQFVDNTHLPAWAGTHFEQKSQFGRFPIYGENADAIFGLAAAKAGGHKMHVALNYLVRNIEGYTDISNADGFGPYDGSVAKLAVAAIVAGSDPRDVGGHDLIATLAADECEAASATCAAPGAAANIFSSISESFVLLAEVRAGANPTPDAVSYFRSLQCANGGFTSGTAACGSGHTDVDATSYAIMALTALTALSGHPARLNHAVGWLRDHQHAKGFWVSQNVPNTNSTGLAAAALAGADRPLGRAREWLRAQQVAAGRPGAGAFRYAGEFDRATGTAPSPSTLATAQALTGLVDDGSLATLTAAGATRDTKMYAPRIAAPRRVAVGSRVEIRLVAFAADEPVGCQLEAERAGTGFGTLTNSVGGATFRLRLGHAFLGTHTIKCAGSDSKLHAARPITVVASP